MLNSIDPDELIPVQKVIFKRLTSALDDRDTYLKSIADAVIGYPIEDDIPRMLEESIFSLDE